MRLTIASIFLGSIAMQGLGQANDSNVRSLAIGRDDWHFCDVSSQCLSGCCSKQYSDDGRLKCTPGGSPSQCVGNPRPDPIRPPPRRALAIGRDDWHFCDVSSQCLSGCCSKQYSDDGRLKCTPGGSPSQCVGNPRPDPIRPPPRRALAIGRDDWHFCDVSSQCLSGCCSKQYSDDGRLKCTPGGSPSQCVGNPRPDPIRPPPRRALAIGRDDWHFCDVSSQCLSGCCSKQYSDDGRLKCTPGGSPSQCVGNPRPDPIRPPPRRALAIGRDDWHFCDVSSQCLSGCCSKQYSDDGRLKCTPGGSPSQCVGNPRPDPIRPPPRRALAIGRDDWHFCDVSSQCLSGCCSKQYSDDGRLKCTPGGSPSQCVGNPRPDPIRPPPRRAVSPPKID